MSLKLGTKSRKEKRHKMAIGKTLQDARLRKKMTTSQVAAATRIKIQLIEAIERDDFSRMSAPIYGKGFIKLYAECVELDPKPLIDEYMTHYAPAKKPSLKGDGTPVVVADERATGAPPEPAGQPKSTDSKAGLLPGSSVDRNFTLSSDVPPRVGETKEDAQTDPRNKPAGPRSGLWQGENQIDDSAVNPFESRSIISILKYVSIAVGAVLVLIFLVSVFSRIARKTTRESKPSAAVQQPQEKLRVAVKPPAPYVD
jgi:hypothetical protein